MTQLGGLFAQLNEAALGNPLNHSGSPVPAGMTPRPMDSVHPLLAQAAGGLSRAAGVDPREVETSREAFTRGNASLAEAMKSEDPEALKQAAAELFAMGRMQEGAAALQMAQAAQAKRNATLEAAGAANTEEAARKRVKAQKRQAVALAKKRGEHDIADALEAGNVDPVDYLKAVMEQKNKVHSLSPGGLLVKEDGTIVAKNQGGTKTLPDGSMLVGEDGTILAENPKDFNPQGKGYGGGSVYNMKAEDEAIASYSANMQTVDSVDRLIEDITPLETSWRAGSYATFRDFITQATGDRGAYERAKTRYMRVKNHEAIEALPKGPASDRDIEIVMRGFPPDNASWGEIMEFLEATKRVAEKLALYDQTYLDYIEGDREGSFLDMWNPKAEAIARQEWIEVTPKEAIDKLLANPTEEMKQAFKEYYHWLPNELL